MKLEDLSDKQINLLDDLLILIHPDIWHPSKQKDLAKFIQEHPEDIVLFRDMGFIWCPPEITGDSDICWTEVARVNTFWDFRASQWSEKFTLSGALYHFYSKAKDYRQAWNREMEDIQKREFEIFQALLRKVENLDAKP